MDFCSCKDSIVVANIFLDEYLVVVGARFFFSADVQLPRGW